MDATVFKSNLPQSVAGFFYDHTATDEQICSVCIQRQTFLDDYPEIASEDYPLIKVSLNRYIANPTPFSEGKCPEECN